MPLEQCPLLGTLDEENRPGPPVEYPSFENRCLAADDRDTLLLADQATWCLSGACRACPRYRAAAATARGGRIDPRLAAELTGGALTSDQLRPELMAAASEGDVGEVRRRWTWLGASVIFVTVVFCGATFAAWSGWQQVQVLLDQRQAGVVQSVASAQDSLPAAPAYIVMTATPSPVVLSVAMAQVDAAQPGIVQPAMVQQPGQQFPAAVTATPGAPGSIAIEPPLIVVEPPVSEPAATPPNILIQVPTRRATPEFDIPTSTAAAETPSNTPTNTPSPTPMGTPVVVFSPAQPFLLEGECTMVSWSVQNVREVYYENVGVDGRGQEEECVDDLLTVLHLVVVLPDGSSKAYTTTLTMIMPTWTPAPTPTFTPEPIFTPTWTPPPPTATPTPSVNYGVVVNVNGSTQQQCTRGGTCEVGLLVTNTGDVIDNLLVGIVASGPWSSMLCRQDGVCASSNLALTAVGPANSAYISLKVTIPADAEAQSAGYDIQAVSTGSGGSVSSGVTTVELTVE